MTTLARRFRQHRSWNPGKVEAGAPRCRSGMVAGKEHVRMAGLPTVRRDAPVSPTKQGPSRGLRGQLKRGTYSIERSQAASTARKRPWRWVPSGLWLGFCTS